MIEEDFVRHGRDMPVGAASAFDMGHYLDRTKAEKARVTTTRTHEARVDELLKANSRLEQEARDGRGEAKRLRSILHEITKGGMDVLRERFEHVTKWKHTAEHDDDYTKDELLRAALCYAAHDLNVADKTARNALADALNIIQPWGIRGHVTRRENVVFAASLLIAELDRIDRAEAAKVGA
jgi:hypothetical protein